MARRVVVVGSGPNGLAAAVRLARAGLEVTALEAAPRLGGGLATEALTLPGFRHDVASAVHPLAAASPVLARMPLARHGLRWMHPPSPLAHPLPDGRAVVLERDPQATAEGLERLHPGDGAAWWTFARPLLRAFGPLRDALLGGFPPLGPGVRLAGVLGPSAALALGRALLAPAEALAAELFAGAGARAWLLGMARHGDVPVDGAGSAGMGAWLALLGHAAGWPSPEGGAARLAEAMAAHLAELGGAVRTGARVERVIVERGRARGVVVAGGEDLLAGLVVCDLVPRGLLAVAGDALPAGYARRLGRWRHGPGALKLDWALSGPIPWTASGARRAGTVHIDGPPFVILGQQSLADPSRAPAGGHTAWAYTTAAPGRLPAPEEVEAAVERLAPGFGELVLARHVMGPAELERRNPNLVGGDVGGGSYALDQLLFRPVPALNPYRTPVRGLYLGSAACWPGGGVHGVAGDAAARAALRRS